LVLGFNWMKPKLIFFIWWVLGHVGPSLPVLGTGPKSPLQILLESTKLISRCPLTVPSLVPSLALLAIGQAAAVFFWSAISAGWRASLGRFRPVFFCFLVGEISPKSEILNSKFQNQVIGFGVFQSPEVRKNKLVNIARFLYLVFNV